MIGNSKGLRAAAFYAVLVSLLVTPVAAGDGKGESKIGLTASLQDNQLDVLLPIWLNSRLVITPAIGGAWVSDVASDVHLGLICRYNLRQGEAVPYLGIRFGTLILMPADNPSDAGMPKDNPNIIDVVLGPLVGGEYFLKERFSVGVEAQINIALSNEKSRRFGNPDGTNINTATAVFATFYF